MSNCKRTLVRLSMRWYLLLKGLMINKQRLIINKQRLILNQILIINKQILIINKQRLMINKQRLILKQRLMINKQRLMINKQRLIIKQRLMILLIHWHFYFVKMLLLLNSFGILLRKMQSLLQKGFPFNKQDSLLISRIPF